jgi:hypothetical protein
MLDALAGFWMSDGLKELQSQPPGGHVGHEYQPYSNLRCDDAMR